MARGLGLGSCQHSAARAAPEGSNQVLFAFTPQNFCFASTERNGLGALVMQVEFQGKRHAKSHLYHREAAFETAG